MFSRGDRRTEKVSKSLSPTKIAPSKPSGGLPHSKQPATGHPGQAVAIISSFGSSTSCGPTSSSHKMQQCYEPPGLDSRAGSRASPAPPPGCPAFPSALPAGRPGSGRSATTVLYRCRPMPPVHGPGDLEIATGIWCPNVAAPTSQCLVRDRIAGARSFASTGGS
jgi:hypothetical protein